MNIINFDKDKKKNKKKLKPIEVLSITNTEGLF